jgi:lipopolysaccharide transport system ATP-binding protein
MQSPKIDIKNLSKIFYHRVSDMLSKKDSNNADLSTKDKMALRDINVTIQSGDILGIIGRNGAGKSTLLSIIAGIAKQTQGTLSITGKVTAIMTLGVGLREDLTGRENIYLDGEIQGHTKNKMDLIMDKIIDFAQLEDFIDKPVKTYSTGMKSRLAFSMLVEVEPEILIIDEALSAGDVFFAEKASKKIREICQKGKIVILVSHSMGAIQSMCNRCLWMEQGEIIMDNAPQTVTQAYLKKVKEEDDLTQLSALNTETSNQLEEAFFKIRHIQFKKIGQEKQQSVFYTQDSFSIEVTINRMKWCDAFLTLSIERIDGLIIHHQRYPLAFEESGEEEADLLFTLALESLVLNKGYYQLNIELVEKGVRSNFFTRLFEVKNNQMPSGGSPLLHYPVEIINKEQSRCLDSIELTAE